jgi:hypothetical protein
MKEATPTAGIENEESFKGKVFPFEGFNHNGGHIQIGQIDSIRKRV